MNTLGYLKIVIRDEIRAIKEEIKESKLLAATFFLAIIGLLIYLKPFPNRDIYFLSGYPNSDWSVMAKSTADILHKNGLNISVLNTDGAVENVIRLDNENDDANAGFTYGLALQENELQGIYSLGSVGYEPVWILYNKSKIGESRSPDCG